MKNKIECGDCLEVMRDKDDDSMDCIVTSPPYWGLRDYGAEGQIGLEPTLDEYHKHLLKVTAECKRVLKKTGTMFWVHGDSYGNSGGKQQGRKSRPNQNERYEITRPLSGKPKCLTMQNYRLAERMIDEQGWILRNINIWHKKNPMPSSAQDRFTNAYEPVFFFTKSKKYHFDLDAIRIPHKVPLHAPGNKNRILKTHHFDDPKRVWGNPQGKNPGDVFTIASQPSSEAHYAAFPENLIEPFIKVGCPAEVCKHCGFIRERITERTPMKIKRSNWGEQAGNQTASSGTMLSPPTSKTIGWTDCTCKDKNKYEPGIVLDPFMGAGTTAVAAKKLGRDYIGIELNREYIEISKKRLNKIPVRLDTFF